MTLIANDEVLDNEKCNRSPDWYLYQPSAEFVSCMMETRWVSLAMCEYSGRKAYGLRARDLPFWGIERVFLAWFGSDQSKEDFDIHTN